MENRKEQQPQEERLLVLFERCGHFIYHSRGGNSGKRKILGVLQMTDEMPQKQLQHFLGIQSGTISESINKLVAEELVERFVSTEDKRQKMLRITAKGEAELEKIKSDEIEAGYFDSLTLQECVVLEQILGKLANEWQIKAQKRPTYTDNHPQGTRQIWGEEITDGQ